MKNESLEIAGLRIDNFTYQNLIEIINDSIHNNRKRFISYANANTINQIYNHTPLKELLNSFDVIHPDGAGIFMASRFLFRKDGFKQRITGSDFYPMLAEEAVKNNYRIFFFGHDKATLDKINVINPKLNVCGTAEGYNFVDDKVIADINKSGADILVIGLSFPKQEEWLMKYKDKLNIKVGLCVGDGIKVFAGAKSRGPKLLRKMGMEWVTRLLLNPVKYSRRYIIGNPLFLYRIITIKIRKFMR